MKTILHHKVCVLKQTIYLSLLLIACMSNLQSWGQIHENIQSWTAHAGYGNYTQEIEAGSVVLEACIVQPNASANGEASPGRIQMQAENGIVELPLLPSVGTVELALVAGGSNRSLTLQYLLDNNWTDLVTWTDINTTGAIYTFEMNQPSSVRLRLANPSHTVYVHDIHISLHSTESVINTSAGQLSNLNYGGAGPSLTQYFVLSGANLDGSDISLTLPGSSPFELAESEQGVYSGSISLPSYDGAPKQIYVRLASGLNIGEYNDVITITGGGATSILVILSGSVIPLPTITDDITNGTVGADFSYILQTTGNPISFELVDGLLPEGITLDEGSGILSGLPNEAGIFEIQVTATNEAGNSPAATIILQIAKGIQSITLNDINAYTGDMNISLPSTSNEGVLMLYNSDNPDVVVISGNSINISNAGYAIITASNSGNDNYEPFSTTFTVTVSNSNMGGNSDLFFSEYIEGSSNNKYLEIYNGSGYPVELGEYTVELYQNGSASPSNTLNLGTLLNILPSGEVIILRHNSANIHDDATMTFVSSAICNFNGDDAVVLKRNGVIIDIIGQIGCDPGTSWTANGGFNTLDKTLVRRPEVCSGITVNPSDSCGPGSFPSLATEWIVLPLNDVSNLGGHTTECTSVPSTPAITLGSVSSGACVNIDNVISIAYSSQYFEGSPTFTAQLSNASGDFSTPVASGSGPSPILIPIPANTLTPGGTYRIRVISDTIQSNQAVFIAHAKPEGIITALNGTLVSEPMCAGTEAAVKFTAIEGVSPFFLTFNDGEIEYLIDAVVSENGVPTPIQIEPGINFSKTYMLIKIEDANGCISEE